MGVMDDAQALPNDLAQCQQLLLAAFKQAREEDTFEQWSDMLRFLTSVASDPTMAGVIADPRVEESRLIALVLGICEGRLSKTGENFVRVLAENRRLLVLREIAEIFESERSEFEKRGRVEVKSAFELDPQYQAMIQKAVAKRLGRDVDLTVTVDKALIGGVVIRAGDVVIDASLRGRLQQLRAELA